MNRENFVERVVRGANTGGESVTCGGCGKQTLRWRFPTALGRELAPPRRLEDAGPPVDACPPCWAAWALDLFERAEREASA